VVVLVQVERVEHLQRVELRQLPEQAEHRQLREVVV
jgi:hypothetical protein